MPKDRYDNMPAGERKKRYGFLLALLAYGTVLKAAFLWAVPYDGNFTAMFPEYLAVFRKVLSFGFAG